MLTLRGIVSLALAVSVAPALLSCNRAKDPDCVSREALNNVKLIIASNQGNVKAMNDMINAGADVNISDDVFGTPLASAAGSRSYEAVKLLVDKGADVNVPDPLGLTPLMLATMNGNTQVVQLLLQKGADANATNKKRSGKFTALAVARAKNNEEIVKLLEGAGAKE